MAAGAGVGAGGAVTTGGGGVTVTTGASCPNTGAVGRTIDADSARIVARSLLRVLFHNRGTTNSRNKGLGPAQAVRRDVGSKR